VSSILKQVIFLHLSAVRTHPSAGNELPVYPFVKPLHLMCAILVLAELVLHIHKEMYIFERIKANRTKN
jgi:hypothetical protein